ncbi:hypothetical protein G3N57_33930, partial [Paraburkholderia sp. Se-20369]|nr:hypothetical protein [Paraburkholderia sp. Se-20369]
MTYLLLKAAHVLAVVTFAGGLLMLSVCVRIANLAVQRAARRWGRAVTAPAYARVRSAGIGRALHEHWVGAAWLSAKRGVVVATSAVHGRRDGTLRRRERWERADGAQARAAV